MHQYKGKLIVHTGSMFSGKTSSLERDMKRFTIAGYKVVAFKPSIDIRSGSEKIVTHDNTSFNAVMVEGIYDIVNFLKNEDIDVVGIDEVQFLGGDIDDILEEISKMLLNGKTVVVSGLDMDYMAKPFEIVKELMPRADYLNKHHAVCKRCGTDAWVSHRKVSNRERVVIGASDEYEPLCRTCYEKALEEDRVNENQEKFL